MGLSFQYVLQSGDDSTPPLRLHGGARKGEREVEDVVRGVTAPFRSNHGGALHDVGGRLFRSSWDSGLVTLSFLFPPSLVPFGLPGGTALCLDNPVQENDPPPAAEQDVEDRR